MRLRGISTGTVSVKVTVETLFETNDISQQQIVDNKVLSDTFQIHVFPSFSIVSNGHTIDERVILMSPNSQLSLQSNRIGEADSQFELLSARNVKLSSGSDRVLKAGDSSEVSTLVVKTNEKFGVTLTSVYGIRVDKISYLMINAINSLVSDQTINVFPIGSELQIRVSFHDNIGKTFYSTRSQIRWTLSRNDLIQISRGSDNTTLLIRSLKEGRTVIKVFDTENNIFDFFSVDVGAVIEPNNLKISVGEVVCLHSKLTASKSGLWSVENPSVGDIDKTTGVFVARNGGHTLIEWKSTEGLTTFTSIDAMPPKRFGLDTTRFKGITNSVTQSIPIVIISQNEGHRRSHCSPSADLLGLESIQSPFSCEIAFDNSLQIKSLWNIGIGFDINSGQWMCRFEPKPDLNLAELSLINGNVSISLIMSAPIDDLESNYKPLIHTISVPFLPAFDVSPKQVILSPDQSEAGLSVHSVPLVLEKLSIVSSNVEIIETTNSEINGNSLRIIIRVKNWDIFSNDVSNLHILINSKTTKQSVKIPIQIKLFRHNIQKMSSSQQFFRDNTISLIVSTVLAILLIAYVMRYLSQRATLSPPILPSNPNSPFMADLQTPLKGHRGMSSFQCLKSFALISFVTALDYSSSRTPSSPIQSSTPRVGRPLYSVPNT